MRERRPVSRIDSDDTHGFLARVYRIGWSRGKMFSDSVYGGRDIAECTAWDWQKRVDKLLPVIPPKPKKKVAKFRLRKNMKGRDYDVYLPMPGRGKPKQKSLHFSDIKNMEARAAEAYQLVTQRNALLDASYRLAYAAWKKEHDRIMQKIL